MDAEKKTINIKILKIVSVFLAVFWVAVTGALIYTYFVKTFVYPVKYEKTVMVCAEKYNLNPYLILSVIRVESGFNEKAVSDRGAKGLMQLTDTTADYVAEMNMMTEFDVLDGKTNIEMGTFYLYYLTNKFKSVKVALTAYNAGEGVVSSWLADGEYSADGLTLYKIPYAETREYLEKIYQSLEKYKKLYGNILDKSNYFE